MEHKTGDEVEPPRGRRTGQAERTASDIWLGLKELRHADLVGADIRRHRAAVEAFNDPALIRRDQAVRGSEADAEAKKEVEAEFERRFVIAAEARRQSLRHWPSLPAVPGMRLHVQAPVARCRPASAPRERRDSGASRSTRSSRAGPRSEEPSEDPPGPGSGRLDQPGALERWVAERRAALRELLRVRRFAGRPA